TIWQSHTCPLSRQAHKKLGGKEKMLNTISLQLPVDDGITFMATLVLALIDSIPKDQKEKV
ncbi:MAG: hypothetical protein U0K47_01180, partial [Erysipelotrichaceae bacterium]|nr:hypothetical protein [Erysipelotrichaceae bacterium]